ncbi:MAG: hypothetical protein M0D53_01860 [Flavobacterium sp. JAD_PAG50586_2]|nr:MAG: hypothetical protein M0D53_01860 [Flavobacterium sp. JAD_PAG50586_2]
MKYIVICLLLVFSSCSSQVKEFSLIGRWEMTEFWGSDGAKTYTEKRENQKVFTFEPNNIVKDKLGNQGTFEVSGENLHIVLPSGDEYYHFHYDKKDVEKLFLSPRTEKYEIICDEGCEYVFEKI